MGRHNARWQCSTPYTARNTASPRTARPGAHCRRPARTVDGRCTRRSLLPRCRARDPLARAPIRRHLHARGGVGLRGTMQGGVARRGELGRQPGHAPAQRGRSRRHPARQRRCLKCLMISAPRARPARLCGGARGRTSACPSQPAREASSVSDTLVGRSAGQGRAKRHGAHLTGRGGSNARHQHAERSRASGRGRDRR